MSSATDQSVITPSEMSTNYNNNQNFNNNNQGRVQWSEEYNDT